MSGIGIKVCEVCGGAYDLERYDEDCPFCGAVRGEEPLTNEEESHVQERTE